MSRLKGNVGLLVASTLALPALVSLPVAGWAQIDEIVVTTRKKSESLQDVPLAIDAITSEQIERLGISDLADVVKLTPSVQFDNSFGPSDTRITIRGLSNTRGRSNVAFLVDGIDVTTENLVTAGSGLLANRRLLNDVERIEVVKGPQSALFGRSAFAGAISYTSKEPSAELEGALGIDYGEEGQRQLNFSLGGPVKGMEEKLGLRVSGVWWDEKGRFTNSVSGNDVGGTEGFGAALTGVFTPTDAVKIKARVEYSDEQYEPRPVARIGGGLPAELQATDDGSQDNTWENVTYGINNQTRVTLDTDGDGFPDLNPNSTYTCASGNEFKRFPVSALNADFGVGTAFSNTALGLADFGPGFCIPTTFGNADNLVIAQSEDPYTGEDYEGTDQQTFRASLQASLDLEFGTATSYTGYTDFHAFDTYDQDYQARGRPDTLLGHQNSRTTNDTEQFSQELRFASELEGSLQFTAGALYWQEDRQLHDQNWIVFCAPLRKEPGPNGARYGVPTTSAVARSTCNGQEGTLSTWQEAALQLPVNAATNAANGLPAFDDPYMSGVFWNADTRHFSLYFLVEWDITDTFKLSVEDRLVWEKFRLAKPAKASCTTSAFAAGNMGVPPNPLVPASPLQDESSDGSDIVCEYERLLNPQFSPAFPADTWNYIVGTERSQYQTPKVTLEWAPTDDSLLYFFWAAGQKPGGISQVTGGGFAETIDDGRFDAEKLQAWELGSKTSWEAAGYLQVNAAAFFQDYTDKQIGTQILVGDVLSPRIINAGGAEVWGIELDAIWQPSFVEGLTLTGAYTWLDAEYTEYIFDSASLQRSAALGECNVTNLTPGALEPELTCRYDLAGNKLERTPEHAVVLTTNFTRPFFSGDVDWLIDINAIWQDDRFVEDTNATKFESYWLLDARLGLAGENWDATLYIDNLLDDDTIITGGSGPDFGEQVTQTGFTAGFGVTHFFAQIPDPRTLGIRVNYRF